MEGMTACERLAAEFEALDCDLQDVASRVRQASNPDREEWEGKPDRIRAMLQDAYLLGQREAISGILALVPDGATVRNPKDYRAEAVSIEQRPWMRLFQTRFNK